MGCMNPAIPMKLEAVGHAVGIAEAKACEERFFSVGFIIVVGILHLVDIRDAVNEGGLRCAFFGRKRE